MFVEQNIELKSRYQHLSKREQFDKIYSLYGELSKQNNKKALEYIQYAVTIAELIQDKNLIGKSYIELCKILKRNGRYEKAITTGLQGIKYLNPTTQKGEIAKAYNLIGLCYKHKGDLEQALSSVLLALKIIEPEKKQLPDFVAGTHLNLATIYLNNKDYENSLKHSTASLHISKEYSSLSGIYRGHNTCGNIYLLTNQTAQAKPHYSKALEIARKLDNQKGIAVVYNNLAMVHEKEGDFKKALEYVFKSINIKKNLDDKHSIMLTYDRISLIYNSMGEFGQALEYLNKGLALAEEIGAKLEKSKLFEKFAKTYAALGDFKKAYEFHQKFAELKEQVYNEDKARSIAEMRVRYDLEQKERETEIHKTAEAEIRKYADQLEASNEDLENFAHIVSHDLKEPLRMVKSYLGLIKRFVDKKTLKRTEEFFHYAIDGAQRMENLITDILALSRISRSDRAFEPTDLNDILFIIVRNLNKLLQDKEGVVYYNNLPTLRVDDTQITQLLQNLVGNGIKYNENPKPTVTVNCERQLNHFLFSVKDNGIGIPKAQYKRIFEMFQRLNNRKKYTGTGIGLAICKKIVERHDGKIWVESEEGKGSTFYFTLPLELAINDKAGESKKANRHAFKTP